MIQEPKNMLIVGVDWLGDVLFSTSLLRALKEKFPSSRVVYAAPRRCLPILFHHPYVDEAIAYDEKLFVWGVFENIRFLKELRKRKFDTAILLHRSKTRAFLTMCAGIPQRVGYSYKGNRPYLTYAIKPPTDTLHRVLRYFALLEPLGIRPDLLQPVASVTESEILEWLKTLRSRMKDSFASPKYVVLHAGANWELKRWPTSYFMEVARRLMDRGLWVVLCGTSHEIALATEIEKCGSRVLSFCGETNLRQLFAMISQAEFIISNDSGPLHIASALNVRSISIFGPTDPLLTGPLSRTRSLVLHQPVGCEVPCYFERCHHRICMEAISPNRVMEAVDTLMNETLIR